MRRFDFAYIEQILENRQIARGNWTKRLEKALGERIKTRYAASTSSGTAGLHLALLALGVGKGDEVLAPSYTCACVIHAIHQTGARPRLVDLEPQTWNVSPNTVLPRLTKRSKALIVTHTFGSPAPLAELLTLGIPVIEDCAAALGAIYRGHPAGGWGVCSIFSFYATKMICAGEGGMVCTNREAAFRRILDLNEHTRPEGGVTRYNYKLSDLAAGLAFSQLKRLSWILRRRLRIADCYRKALQDCGVQFQEPEEGAEPSHYRFVIQIPGSAAAVIRKARRIGIGCDRPVLEPLHRHLPGYSKSLFPNTETLFHSAVSVPIYPALSDTQIVWIARQMRNVLKGRS